MDQRDPILLVTQACYPQLLSLDDLLAARLVCKAWHHSLSSAFCNTWRLPHSIWHTISENKQLVATISAAAAAYQHAPLLLLDSGNGRPALPASLWEGLCLGLRPWVTSSSSNTFRGIKLQMRNPPSPQQLHALQSLPCLHSLHIQHTHSAIYSRHMGSIAQLKQLRDLGLFMVMPKLELRNLAHHRLRRVPLKADCLSALVHLQRLDVSCRSHAGDLVPDSLLLFSNPSILAALSALTHLSLSESALPGPWAIEEWLQPLAALSSLQLVMLDDPGTTTARTTAGSSTGCSTGGPGPGPSNLLNPGSLGAALAAAAQAAGSSRGDTQLVAAQQNLLAGLQNLSSVLQQAASSSGPHGRGVSSGSGTVQHVHAAHSTPHSASAAGPGNISTAGGTTLLGAAGGGSAVSHAALARTSSSTSTNEPDTPSVSDATGMAAAAAAAAVCRPLLPIHFRTCCPNLHTLVLANLHGDRCALMTMPAQQLTRLVLHLANPSPGPLNGEQLAAVILQTSSTLVSLELGLGMRFSLSGGVMRSLKRSLKQLRSLTLIEGAQDHLEGLGCWCNLPQLTLVGGRCTVPLRGLYELSMRAAMGRSPGVLSYHGHSRHVEELASRLGSALQELKLDNLSGLGGGYKAGLGARSNCSPGGSSSSATGSPRHHKGSAQAACDGCGADDSSDDDVTEVQGTALLPALAQLNCLTRLEVAGVSIGVLDRQGMHVLSSCKHLRLLTIQGAEPWLATDHGVKEQLCWLSQLPQLRRLWLVGVMLGRSRLAGEPPAVAATAAASRSSQLNSNSSTRGAGSHSSHAAAPRVKGLGNGLSCVSPSVKDASGGSSASSAAAAPHTVTAAAADTPGSRATLAEDTSAQCGLGCTVAQQQCQRVAVPGPVKSSTTPGRQLVQEAVRQEAAAALCLEELRRWLCEMLPGCRVWLD